MKIRNCLAMMIIFTTVVTGSVDFLQASTTGNLNLLIGRKVLNEDDWDPLEDQGEFGVRFDFRQTDWPVNLAIDLLFSSDEETLGNGDELKGRTTELDLGVRKIWQETTVLRPFVGGGLGMVNGGKERTGNNPYDESDSSVGLWLCGGLYWTLAEVFNIGFEARWSHAEVDINGDDVNAGGRHLGLLVGYHY